MDRLDTWLNAQRGWRRFSLLWLGSYPLAMCLGVATTGWQDLAGNHPPGAVYILWPLALSVPGALLLAGLMLLARSLSARRAIYSSR
jgi:hypothetical protein